MKGLNEEREGVLLLFPTLFRNNSSHSSLTFQNEKFVLFKNEIFSPIFHFPSNPQLTFPNYPNINPITKLLISMAIRLYNFQILTGNSPLLQAVVATLNNSYVRDTTSIDLLTALAQTESFKVFATGDYDTLLSSEDLINSEPSEDAIEWLSSITSHLTELSL